MTQFTITIGAWIIPALLSLAATIWFCKQDYRGAYNVNALFTLPATAFVICFVWMVYFGLRVALS